VDRDGNRARDSNGAAAAAFVVNYGDLRDPVALAPTKSRGVGTILNDD
jgi:hypothetical protein